VAPRRRGGGLRHAERLAVAVARAGLTQALKLDACLTSARFPLHRCRPFADAIATLLRETGDRPCRPGDSSAGCSADCRRGHDVSDHPGTLTRVFLCLRHRGA
jgi:hypothetical protein